MRGIQYSVIWPVVLPRKCKLYQWIGNETRTRQEIVLLLYFEKKSLVSLLWRKICIKESDFLFSSNDLFLSPAVWMPTLKYQSIKLLCMCLLIPEFYCLKAFLKTKLRNCLTSINFHFRITSSHAKVLALIWTWVHMWNISQKSFHEELTLSKKSHLSECAFLWQGVQTHTDRMLEIVLSC